MKDIRSLVFHAVVTIGFLVAFQNASAAWQSGLRCGFHVNGANDFDSVPIWTGSALDTIAATNKGIGAATSTSPVVTNWNGTSTSVWTANRVWYYWGEIYLPAGEVTFGAAIDDYSALEIDGEQLFRSVSGCQLLTASRTFQKAGWHNFVFKAGDNGGGAGPISGRGVVAGYGFAIKENGATAWSYPADDGTMNRYRYDDGLGFHDTLHIGASPALVGTPQPAYGDRIGLDSTSSFMVSAGDPISNAKTNAVFKGYVLSNLVDETYISIGQGTEASFDYVHNGLETILTWLWDVRYVLDVSARANGSVAPVPEWVGHGEQITLEAIPDPGYAFLKWEGDIPAFAVHDPSPVLTVDSAKTIQAVFGRVRFVAPTGDDSHDGSSWDQAFATLQAAVAAAADGQVILLAPGVYPLSAAITIDRPLTIVGTGESPGDVIVKRGSGNQRIFILNHPEATIRHLVASDGTGWGEAGSNVCIYENGGTVIDCILRNGQSKWGKWGGGVYIASEAGLVRNCVISNNYACDYNHLGGVAVGMTAGRVENCLIVKNGLDPTLRYKKNQKELSIVRISGGTMVNCTIADNWLYNTAGIYVDTPNPLIANCLIAGNTSISGGAEVFASFGDLNRVFVACASDGDRPINDTCFLFDGEPNFADRLHGDYHLASGSICVDAGVIPDGGLSTVDLDGNSRVNNGCPDIGAYELQLPEGLVTGLRVPAGYLYKAGDPVVFQPSVRRAAGTVRYEFDFGDGQSASATDTTPVSHAFAKEGAYTVTLTATDSTGSSSASRVVYVIDDTIRVVEGNPKADEPYATWETAAPDLGTAYAFARDGFDIVISNGTYRVPKGFVLTKGVRFYGASGKASDVVIEPVKDLWCGLFVLAHPRNLLSGLTLRKNVTSNHRLGGGAGIIADGAVITNCHFYRDRSYVGGAYGSGAVMEKAGLITHCLFEECDVDDNGAPGGAVAMFADGRVENCLFLRNKTALASHIDGREEQKAAAGVYMTAGVLRNCSFIGNRSLNVGGVYLTGGVVSNCLFAGNTSEGTKGCPTATVFDGDASAFHRCAADTVLINETCLQGNVDFTDAANDDFSPDFASVAFGNGAVVPEDLTATDLAGNPRVSADGKMDIGCYEKVYAGLGVSILVTMTSGIVPFETTFSAVLPTVDDPSAIECKWDFGDGQTMISEGATSVSHTYETPGDYTITLTVSDGHETATALLEKGISPRPRVLYVKKDNASAEEPYDTAGKAAKEIGIALDYAVDGCEIVVLPGEYPISRELVISKGISIRSSTGCPEDVVVARKSNSWLRPFELNHSDAVLAGITVAAGKIGGLNSHKTGGGNILINTGGGLVSNCVIRGGNSWNFRGGGIAVRSAKGLVTHCVVTNNGSTDGNFPAGTGVYIREGIVRDCLIAGNTYLRGNGGMGRGAVNLQGGALLNCTIVDNSVMTYSGVTCEAGGVTNCVIARNQASKATSPEQIVYGNMNPGAFVSCVADIVQMNDTCRMDDPGFVDAENGDYRLGAGSPCIDMGSMDCFDSLSETDLDGNIRVQHRVVDIGCYERRYVTPAMMLIIR